MRYEPRRRDRSRRPETASIGYDLVNALAKRGEGCYARCIMLMELNPRVSKGAACSHTTVGDRTCKATAMWFCSGCDRLACGNHAVLRDGQRVCAACDFQFRQLTTATFEDTRIAYGLAGLPILAKA